MINIIILILSLIHSYDYVKNFNTVYTSIHTCLVAYSSNCVNTFKKENLDFFSDKMAPNVLNEINQNKTDKISYRQYYDALSKKDSLVGLLYLNKNDADTALTYLNSSISIIDTANIRPYYPNLRLAKELYDYLKKNNQSKDFNKLNSFFKNAAKVCNTMDCKDKLNAINNDIKNNKPANFNSFLIY